MVTRFSFALGRNFVIFEKLNLCYEKVYIVAVFRCSLVVFLRSGSGVEQYFVDIHGDLRYESQDRFQASLSTNVFGDKVYKDNRGNGVKYSKAMWEKVPGKDRPYFEDFLFSELIHKYRDQRNVHEVYEIDIFGDARYPE